ncbi:MAG: hypothetical protein R3E12_06490 [Candidatus Eisenbacteria bacterium]
METETDREPNDRRVLVAMSGGVDSSVAAALLQEQGGTSRASPSSSSATARKGRRAAPAVDSRASAMRSRWRPAPGISHTVLDLVDLF